MSFKETYKHELSEFGRIEGLCQDHHKWLWQGKIDIIKSPYYSYREQRRYIRSLEQTHRIWIFDNREMLDRRESLRQFLVNKLKENKCL